MTNAFSKTLSVATAALMLGALTGCDSEIKGPIAGPTGASNIYFTADSSSAMQGYVDSFPVATTGTGTPVTAFTPPAGFFVACVAIGPTGNMYIGGETSTGAYEVLEYAAGATSSSAPIATFTGSNGNGTFDIPYYLVVNSAGQLFVEDQNGDIAVFAANAATGDEPAQLIGTLDYAEEFSQGLGADSAGNVYVILDGAIAVFAAGATGNATPVRTITSTATEAFTDLSAITADAAGNIIVANYNSADDPYEFAPVLPTNHRNWRHYGTQRWSQAAVHSKPAANASPRTLPDASTGIYVFAAGASGTPTPTLVISGTSTTVNRPMALSVDAADNIYYVDQANGTPAIMVFPAGTTGNVAPRTSFTSSVITNNGGPDLIAVY